MTKELLTIEFRYYDKPKSEAFSGYETKTITIGVFDTLEDAVIEGTKVVAELAKSFEVRHDDKFAINGLFGLPNRLVTNCCYPTKGIQFFAKITKLEFNSLNKTITETFEAFYRYKEYKKSLVD